MNEVIQFVRCSNSSFVTALNSNKIQNSNVYFIEDVNKIYVNGKYYDGSTPVGDAIKLNTFTDTIDNTTIISSDSVSTAISKLQTQLKNLINQCNTFNFSYYSGESATTNISKIPINKRVCIATLTEDGILGLESYNLPNGKELHVIIRNDADKDITITIPSYDLINTMEEDTIVIESGSYAEINIVSTVIGFYVRGVN